MHAACGDQEGSNAAYPADPFDPVTVSPLDDSGATSGPPLTEIPTGLVFDPPGGGFQAPLAVTIAARSGQGTIHYTLDGSLPTNASPVYTGPISLQRSAQIRALLLHPTSGAGTAPREFDAASYVALETEVASFDSNLPLIVIDRHGDRPIETWEDELRSASWLVFEPGQTRASLLGAATFSGRAGLRVRGQSSRGFPQKSYTVELWRADSDEDRSAHLLGMPAESDWALIAPSEIDRSLMRTMLPMDLSRRIGSYAPRTRFVEVFLVDRERSTSLSRSDYLGVYTLTERIKRDANRVAVSKLEPGDTSEPMITGGYMFRIDHGESNFRAGDTDFQWVYPDADEFAGDQRRAQAQYLRGHLNEFFDALRASNFTHPGTGRHYTQYIDRARWIDHNLLNALLKNVDGLRLSSYFHKDRNGPIVAGPIWDFDRSSGTPHDERAERADEWARGDGTHPLRQMFWGELFRDPEFERAYWARWDELARGPFSTATLHALIDEYDTRLSEARVRHFERWRDLPPRDGAAGEVAILRRWLAERVTWLSQQRP